jgi:hypothetical protein
LGLQSAIGAKHAAHISALLSVILGGIVMVALLIAKDVSIHFSASLNFRQLDDNRSLDIYSVMIKTL